MPTDMRAADFTRTAITLSALLVITMTTTCSERMEGVCDVIPDRDVRAAGTIWNYMLLNHTVHQVRLASVQGYYHWLMPARALRLH